MLLSAHPPVKPQNAGGPNLTHYNYETCAKYLQHDLSISCLIIKLQSTKAFFFLEKVYFKAVFFMENIVFICNLPTCSYRRQVQMCRELNHSDMYSLDVCRKGLVGT